MFFWNNPSSEIELGMLDKELDALFDKKLEKFAARASRFASEIASAKKEFIGACDEFDSISAEPDTEFKRWLNPNSLKNQKSAYVMALKRTFGAASSHSGSTSYSRYSAELASLKSLIGEMLSVNGRNKDVINAYSRHIGHFKRLQAVLESLASGLGAELNRVSREFNEYNEVTSNLSRLKVLCEELDAVRDELERLKDSKSSESIENTAEIETKLTAKQSELTAIRKQIDAISSKVTALVLPLEKAARAYDHSALEKTKLLDMVENPVQSLATEHGFQEFIKRLEALKEGIDVRRIELKKPNETLSQIAKIGDAKVYEELSRMALLKKEAQSLEGEARFFEREISRIRDEARESESRLGRMEELSSSIKKLEESRKKERETLEQLITRYYKKKVTIDLKGADSN